MELDGGASSNTGHCVRVGTGIYLNVRLTGKYEYCMCYKICRRPYYGKNVCVLGMKIKDYIIFYNRHVLQKTLVRKYDSDLYRYNFHLNQLENMYICFAVK